MQLSVTEVMNMTLDKFTESFMTAIEIGFGSSFM